MVTWATCALVAIVLAVAASLPLIANMTPIQRRIMVEVMNGSVFILFIFIMFRINRWDLWHIVIGSIVFGLIIFAIEKMSKKIS